MVPTGVTTGITGTWSGMLQSDPHSGPRLSVTLMDSSGTVSATAPWGGPYAVLGNHRDSSVTFAAKLANSGTQPRSFSGVLAGDEIAGHLVKGASAIRAAFTSGTIVAP